MRYLLLILLLIGSTAHAGNDLKASWTEPSANAIGTILYELKCSVPFTPAGGCAGEETRVQLVNRARNPGSNTCGVFNRPNDNTCYHYEELNYFQEEGIHCFGVVSYDDVSESSGITTQCMDYSQLLQPAQLWIMPTN